MAIFGECPMTSGRMSLTGPGRVRNQGNDPYRRVSRFALDDRPDHAGYCRSVGSERDRPAIELRDSATPGFLLVSRFEREHSSSPVLGPLSNPMVSRV